MSEIIITESVDVYSVDPKRVGKKDRWVTYSADGTRAGIVILPAEGANEATILAAIKQREAERAKLVGKKFTV